jgi:hypothetical protein
MKHFNLVMNNTHDQYKKATKTKSMMKTKFPTTRFGSPIKKMMNIRAARTLDFNFENVKVEGISKNISISFNKNKFEIQVEGMEKPLKGKDLGKLLETRERGNRIFDGMELKMVNTVYRQLIVQLRKNAKIENSNFGVKDPIKNRVYFLDKAGDM